MNQQELRDQFAMRAPAMHPEFARRGKPVEKVIQDFNGRKRLSVVNEWETPAEHAARWAYEFADAMLALRGAP